MGEEWCKSDLEIDKRTCLVGKSHEPSRVTKVEEEYKQFIMGEIKKVKV